MTWDRPYYSRNSFRYINPQRNRHLQLFGGCLVQMAIRDINQTPLGKDVFGNIVKNFMKNFVTSSCYNSVIMYVCSGVCTYWLTPIFCSVGCFLYMKLFPVFHSDTSSTFYYSNYMIDILLGCSRSLLE